MKALTRLLLSLLILAGSVSPVLAVTVAAKAPAFPGTFQNAAGAPVQAAAFPDTTPDRVLGQANFTSAAFGAALKDLYWPSGVAVDPQGRLYIVD